MKCMISWHFCSGFVEPKLKYDFSIEVIYFTLRSTLLDPLIFRAFTRAATDTTFKVCGMTRQRIKLGLNASKANAQRILPRMASKGF